MGLRYIVLGSGTSQGVPVIGVDYSPQFLANPKNHRTRPSIYIETDQTKLVIDTTPEFRMQILRENIRCLDAVLITHPHADHIMGMDDCRRFCELRGGKLPVYASPQTMLILRAVFAYAFDGKDIPIGYFDPDPRYVIGPFYLGELEIIPIDLPHGRIISTGYLFRIDGQNLLAYLTDAKYIPEAVLPVLKGTKVVFIDALRPFPHETHMSLHEALDTIKKINPGQAILTHLTHHYDHDRDQQSLPSNVFLAYDGMRGEINLT